MLILKGADGGTHRYMCAYNVAAQYGSTAPIVCRGAGVEFIKKFAIKNLTRKDLKENFVLALNI